MFGFQIAWRRNVPSVLIVFWELLRDGLQFMNVVARPRTEVAAEVLFLRKQLAYYQDHKIRPRRLTDAARLSLVLWSRLFDWKEALAIVTPATFVRWHRRGFRLYWGWKSRGGRPQLPKEARAFPRQHWRALCRDQRFTGTECHRTVRSERWRLWADYITNIGWNRALPEPPKVSAEDRQL